MNSLTHRNLISTNPCNYYGYELPRKHITLVVEGQGMSITWRLRAAKECYYLAVEGRQGIYTVRTFSWRLGKFANVRIYLAVTSPRKLFLAASCQDNQISLALYSWRILLGGRPPKIIYLAVLVLSLVVFGRQGNSSFWYCMI